MAVSKEGFLLEDSMNSLDFKTKIYSYREQEKIMDRWLTKRLDTILPLVMKRSGIDCWVVACNEYNEDPVFMTLVPTAMMSARRFTILAFFLEEDGSVSRYSISRPHSGCESHYTPAWIKCKGHNFGNLFDPKTNGKADDPVFQNEEDETQLECLNRILKVKNPNKIGINRSRTFAFADGLSSTVYEDLLNALDKEVTDKFVSSENVAVGWLETRTDEEVAAYTGIMQIAHGIIKEAYSSRVITPGVTTNKDVKYFILQRVIDLGLKPWFDFSLGLTRKGVGSIEEGVIMPGDVLHCDVGLTYLGLCTDTQENCYILKMDETDAPEELKLAMKTVNRLQDIVIGEYVEGRTGNEVLALSRKKAIEEGINPCIYTHPIGFHGHAAGPTIGLFDMQDGVPGRGDYPLYDHTFYSLELNCRVQLDGWGDFRMAAETDIMFVDGKVHYVAGRQENWHLVK